MLVFLIKYSLCFTMNVFAIWHLVCTDGNGGRRYRGPMQCRAPTVPDYRVALDLGIEVCGFVAHWNELIRIFSCVRPD